MPKNTEPEVHDRAYEAMQSALPENKGKKPAGTLERVSISVAENGFSVDCSYRPPKQKSSEKGGACCGPSYEPPKTKVFESAASLLAFLKSVL